jgi:biotin carboxyl carrier protein
MKYHLLYLKEKYDVDVHRGEDELVVTIGDQDYTINDFVMQENSVSFRMGDTAYRIVFARDNAKIYISLGGEYFTLELSSRAKYGSEGADQQGGNVIASSMPGLLVKLPVKVGDKIKSGDTLAIVEAMKMQSELRSPIDGEVKKINFKEGEQVDAFQTIVEIENSTTQ